MSVKSVDKEGRWRNVTIGFRVSEEENERVNQLFALSGMTKHAFILSKLEDRQINVFATMRMQKASAVQARRVADELERLSAGEQPNARQPEISEAILDILGQMAAGGMTLGDERDEASFEEMELSTSGQQWLPTSGGSPSNPRRLSLLSATGVPCRRRNPARVSRPKDSSRRIADGPAQAHWKRRS